MRPAGESAKNPSVERVVAIANNDGFHTRPVMKFVDMAQTFVADVRVVSLDRENEIVDGKSAMELMLLGATKGTKLRVTTSGPDAEQAADALVALVANRFGLDT